MIVATNSARAERTSGDCPSRELHGSDVNITISLASLAPDIVEAIIAGRLPHGIALRDLTDRPCSGPSSGV